MPSLRTTIAALRFWLPLAALMLSAVAACPQAAPEAATQQRAVELLQRLEQGERITVTVYGDSLTGGMGTDGTHVFGDIFVGYLRDRFPSATIDAQISGNPGWTTLDALHGFDRQVAATEPDLLVVQFGGNDRGWGRSLQQYRASFTRLLERCVAETDAPVIACLPPWAEEIGDSPWSLLAREVAAQVGISAADFHRAIGEGPHDFRGSFPYGSHPGSFTHLLMARELVRVFEQATGRPSTVRARLVRGTGVSEEPQQTIEAVISTDAEEAVAWSAVVTLGRQERRVEGIVSREEPSIISEQFSLDPELPGGRSYSIPAALRVRAGGCADFDVAWLAIAPTVTAEGSPEGAAWHTLGGDELVLGKQHWQGPDDLSARFAVTRDGTQLTITVEVTDDRLTPATLRDPSRGDSVEMYLDLRSPQEQGLPLYSEEVLALQVLAPEAAEGPPLWRNMHELPEDLEQLEVSAWLREDGYSVEVALPLAAVIARRGSDWGGIGLDIGVNDADGGERKSQMMWRGIADNYLNPAYLAGVYPSALPPAATRRVLR